MIRSTTAVVALAFLIVVGTLFWRSHSHSVELATAAMPPLVQMHATAGVDRLPVQDIDDQSLIYSTPKK